MTDRDPAGATGYDGLSSREVPEADLEAFLRDCFPTAGNRLLVARDDRLRERLSGVPDEAVFSVFCTCRRVGGDFALSFDVGVEGRLHALLGRAEFARRFAARFGAVVLYGDDEPPGLWSVVLPDGTRLLRGLDQDGDRFTLTGGPLP
ncbi:hypothetical protein [Actinocorallia longicatena]|uniref:Type III secretion system (T3SS) SseB-like protein n=1 Tax=Actinocorallia longicatena TaxID=111803 RepID=A0ABP6QDT7_9ACTN